MRGSIFAIILSLLPAFAAADPIERNQIEVSDGDTVRIAGELVRLVGFDTPETTVRQYRCDYELEFLVSNPRIRHIPVAKPDHLARNSLVLFLARSLPGAREAEANQVEKAQKTFVDKTEGLLLLDLNAIAQLARSEGLSIAEISDAVRRYKVGVTEDPWRKIDRAKIGRAEEFVRRRVKGQAHAVTHMLDVVKRAVTGIGQSPRGGRPRGVAFLAGPTGVGKTELAKTITSLLFGDESAYIRFDMLEFSAEHADQRLIGAPLGYVGYDVGGELTNAIRERPFSVVLFDEIEKAHPRILDMRKAVTNPFAAPDAPKTASAK